MDAHPPHTPAGNPLGEALLLGAVVLNHVHLTDVLELIPSACALAGITLSALRYRDERADKRRARLAAAAAAADTSCPPPSEP